MIPSTNRIFLVGIIASFFIHIAAVGVVALRASSDDPGSRQALEFIAVEFTQAEQPVEVQRPEITPPPPEPPAPVETPVPTRRVRDSAPEIRPTPQPRQQSSRTQPTTQPGVQTAQRPGGGELNVGSTSTGGDLNLGPGGSTPMGWVPGQGSGTGSGTGSGQGSRLPSGTDQPAPQPVQPAPPPQPAPRQVTVSVCSVSGDRPGQHCTRTVSRSFTEGRQPTRTCTECRAPAPAPQPAPPPQHQPREAEVVKAQFKSGDRPAIPSSVRLNSEVTVTAQFTVKTDGTVTDVTIVGSSGINALDREVIRAVRTYRYTPAKQNNVPREVTMRQGFTFRPTR